jgi:release factor glutamine methyltransferase
VIEHGYEQATRCRALFEQAGFREVASRRDLSGVERVSWGTV